MSNKNRNLSNAKNNKNDEFYTQLSDIENELIHYKDHFKNKTVLCNCDDPFESNFFKYFVLNFNHLKLKKLICTCYAGSPVAGSKKHAYKAVINVLRDTDDHNDIVMDDVAELFKTGENELTELEGDGDFRSQECIELLKEADIVCTNPPFSLFREYVAQLMEYKKDFLILCNHNAVHYSEVFPLLKDNKIWLGYTANKTCTFEVPESYVSDERNDTGHKIVHVPSITWMTNLDIKRRHEYSICIFKYNSDDYHTYDNYDAINVDKVAKIPCNYTGIMGVPDTFLEVHCSEQFEIVGLGCGNLGKTIGVKKNYRGRTDVAYTVNGIHKCPYSRILIRYTDSWIASHQSDFST